MSTYAIENETNNITLHATEDEAQAAENSQQFGTIEELTALAENWPVARLVEICNSLPGSVPVKNFRHRKTAVTRIWNAIQSLGETNAPADRASTPAAEAIQVEEPEAAFAASGTEPSQEPPALESEAQHEAESVAEPGAEVAVDETAANVGEHTPDVAPADGEPAKKATRKPKTPTGEKAVKAPREDSKTSRVIEMLKREGGTTLDEIMVAMGWQKHTTRAMLSAGGSLTKNHGLVVISEMVGDKRTYSIKG